MATDLKVPYDANPCKLPRNTEGGNGGRMYDGRSREQIAGFQVIALHKGEFVNPITCRVWMSTSRNASMMYASIWIRTKDGRYIGGHGSAGGWGYHKLSAAVSAAVRAADIRMHDFGGCGDRAIDVALESIARACGYRKFTVVKP